MESVKGLILSVCGPAINVPERRIELEDLIRRYDCTIREMNLYLRVVFLPDASLHTSLPLAALMYFPQTSPAQ